MPTDDELEAFERGRRFERRQRPLFQGVPPATPWSRGVEFKSNGSWFESCVAYERELREDRRRVQRGLWLARKDMARSSRDERQVLEETETAIEGELVRAVRGVNEVLREGRGEPHAIAGMRATPQRPDHVIELPDLTAFVGADERRALPDWPQRRDAGGADFGFDWLLENPFRRWETTRWRASWLCEGERPTHEAYALECLESRGEQARRHGRVWLLGTLSDWDAAEKSLGVLQRHARDGRNSLVVAAKAVRAAARGEELADLARRLVLEER
jgi:hypothetical protein